MGGHQFASGTTLVDMTALAGVIDVDADRGLVTVGAGIDWVRLINHLLWTFPNPRMRGASCKSRPARIS